MLPSAHAETMEHIVREAESIRTIQAAFVQSKHIKILNKPLISKGMLYFKKPDFLRWEYTVPIRSILMVQGEKIQKFVWKKSENRFIRDASPHVESMRMVSEQMAMWLDGRFEENPAFDARLSNDRTISLTPRNEGFSSVISRIDLYLSRSSSQIERVMIIESRDSYTEIRFEDQKINVPLDDRLFSEIQ